MERMSLTIIFGFEEVHDFNAQNKTQMDVFNEMKKLAISGHLNWGIKLNDFSVEDGSRQTISDKDKNEYLAEWRENKEKQEYYLKITPIHN